MNKVRYRGNQTSRKQHWTDGFYHKSNLGLAATMTMIKRPNLNRRLAKRPLPNGIRWVTKERFRVINDE